MCRPVPYVCPLTIQLLLLRTVTATAMTESWVSPACLDSCLLADHKHLSSIKLINLQPAYTLFLHPLISRMLFSPQWWSSGLATYFSLSLKNFNLLVFGTFANHFFLTGLLCYSLHLLRLGLCFPPTVSFWFNKPSFCHSLCAVWVPSQCSWQEQCRIHCPNLHITG